MRLCGVQPLAASTSPPTRTCSTPGKLGRAYLRAKCGLLLKGIAKPTEGVCRQQMAITRTHTHTRGPRGAGAGRLVLMTWEQRLGLQGSAWRF